MTFRKWRIARAVDRGDLEKLERAASTPELRQYARSLEKVDRLLKVQAAGVRLAGPAELSPRIVDSICEAERMKSPAAGASLLVSRPFLALATAASLAGLLTLAVYIAGMNQQMDPSHVVPDPEAVAHHSAQGSFVLDPSSAILPTGRIMMTRFESPLLEEAELLKQDTQRLGDMVIGSLPFASARR